MPTDKYRVVAKTKFEAVTKDPSVFVWWRLGDSFDTMLDYLDHIDSRSAADVAGKVVTQCQSALKDMGPDWRHTWFDDYGWWTIATLRAEAKTYFDAVLKNQLWELRSECWKRFTENAPYVWDRHKPGTYDDCQPAVAGGVWNQYWVGTSPTYPGPSDGDGKNNGIQNTPTNGLYLIAAELLALAAEQRGMPDPELQAAARREYDFLNAWIEATEDPLWWPQKAPGADAALVRDFVGHYANGGKAPGVQDWAWTGDQGLILGGLTAHMAMGINSANYQLLLRRAKALLTGARCCLVDGDGVLKYASDYVNVPGDDTGDYQTGPGVFWRYALHAWQVNPDLRAFLGGSDYQKFLRTNADAAAAAKDETDVDILTNQLAVLVAATVTLSS